MNDDTILDSRRYMTDTVLIAPVVDSMGTDQLLDYHRLALDRPGDAAAQTPLGRAQHYALCGDTAVTAGCAEQITGPTGGLGAEGGWL